MWRIPRFDRSLRLGTEEVSTAKSRTLICLLKTCQFFNPSGLQYPRILASLPGLTQLPPGYIIEMTMLRNGGQPVQGRTSPILDPGPRFHAGCGEPAKSCELPFDPLACGRIQQYLAAPLDTKWKKVLGICALGQLVQLWRMQVRRWHLHGMTLHCICTLRINLVPYL